MIRSLLVALATVVALGAAGCGGGPTKSSAGSPRQLTELRNITQLQRAFQTASGRPRLIVLVSPT